MEAKAKNSFHKVNKAIVLLTVFFVISLPAILALDFTNASAQDQANFNQILQPIMTIYNLIKYMASAVAGIALLFAGITYMTSGNEPKKRDEAKSMAMYVIIGLVIVWASPILVNMIAG